MFLFFPSLISITTIIPVLPFTPSLPKRTLPFGPSLYLSFSLHFFHYPSININFSYSRFRSHHSFFFPFFAFSSHPNSHFTTQQYTSLHYHYYYFYFYCRFDLTT
ncbi:hypothetical protein RIF29_11419 [Crotalaria pallida]|uniref:Uncharacterized protein n=1 Tax=Crotalaria pallida TaxID=3830 RepID=A0AAN9NZZ9_CROPI